MTALAQNQTPAWGVGAHKAAAHIVTQTMSSTAPCCASAASCYDCTASFLRCSVNTSKLTSSVRMTSLDMPEELLYDDEGFNLASRKRAWLVF